MKSYSSRKVIQLLKKMDGLKSAATEIIIPSIRCYISINRR